MARLLTKSDIKRIISKQKRNYKSVIKYKVNRLRGLIAELESINLEETTSETSRNRNNILIGYYTDRINYYLNKKNDE